MTKWILIIIYQASSGVGTTAVDFQSLNSCQLAANTLIENKRPLTILSTYCVQDSP